MKLGHTVVEMMMTIIVFTFLFTILIQIFSLGLKSWNMIEMKSEVQQESSVSVSLLKKDLLLSDNTTLLKGNEGYEYAVCESALSEDGKFVYDEITGVPLWQSYVLYYTFPRDPNDPNLALDLSLPVNKDKKKKLVRKVIKHNESNVAKKLNDFAIYFTDVGATPVMGEVRVGIPRVLSYHIYELGFTENTFDNYQAIDIRMVLKKSITDDRLAYTKDFSSGVGIETMETRDTVILRNTK